MLIWQNLCNVFQNPKAIKLEAPLIPNIAGIVNLHFSRLIRDLLSEPLYEAALETLLVFLELAGLFSTSGLDLQSPQANGVGKQCLDKAL